MPHQKSSDYKETAVQYYLVEDKTQEEKDQKNMYPIKNKTRKIKKNYL